MDASGGVMSLPMIRNEKTVDPKNKASAKVYQLETAMGAAIEAFGSRATAIVIERDRFAPVKKCDDLLNLRSDAYEVTKDKRIVLHPDRNGIPPTVSLVDTYKMLPAFNALTANGRANPSMRGCKSLKFAKGGKLFTFAPGVVFRGDVTVDAAEEGQTLESGTYTGAVALPVDRSSRL